MGQTWIEDSKRPGGVGRAERERAFWERVASGRKSPGRTKSRTRTARDASLAERAERAERAETAPKERESRWESAYLALVTMLTVVVFGLGWVSFELERATGAEDATGYDWSLRDSGSQATLLARTARARSD